MSDTMLMAVLLMPRDLWLPTPIDEAVRESHYNLAANRIEADSETIRELRAVLTALGAVKGPEGWTVPGCECGHVCAKSPVCAACGQPERVLIDLPTPAKETK